MFTVYFPQELKIAAGASRTCLFQALSNAQVMQNQLALADWDRIYLSMDEAFNGIAALCRDHHLSPPVKVSIPILEQFYPPLLATLLSRKDIDRQQSVRICLFNGGGGGLGDAVLFGAALKVLAARLSAIGFGEVQLDIYSLYPERVELALQGVPSVNIYPINLAVSDFCRYDAYCDLSGFLSDPRVNRTLHMTDVILERLGISPESVSSREKAPFLPRNPSPAPEVSLALANAREQAKGKKILAVVPYAATLTRSLPEAKTVEIFNALKQKGYYSVLLLPPQEQLGKRGDTNVLRQRADMDFSPASNSTRNFLDLLAGVDAIVSVDTAAVHFGAAFGIPTVGLFNAIRMETLIQYSPSVVGIQLSYAGPHCKAPCGQPKYTALLEGRLANGSYFRWTFGYVCDGGINREVILNNAIRRINHLDYQKDVEAQMETIKWETNMEFGDVIHAPCWQNLCGMDVMSELEKITKKLAARAFDVSPKKQIDTSICEIGASPG